MDHDRDMELAEQIAEWKRSGIRGAILMSQDDLQYVVDRFATFVLGGK